MKYINLKDGLRELPKVGFHLWQIFFLGLLRLRGCKGGLLIVWQSSRLPEGFICPLVGTMVQRWASCLRRWAFIVFRPKVGFHLWPKVGFISLVGCKEDLRGFKKASSFKAFNFCQSWQNCQRWALFGQRWASCLRRWAPWCKGGLPVLEDVLCSPEYFLFRGLEDVLCSLETSSKGGLPFYCLKYCQRWTF